MKKAIALILAVILALSLSACGKREEVQTLEARISELSGLSMETLSHVDAARVQIEAVRSAYNALEPGDQAQVENLADLEAAENRVFQAEYAFLVSLIESQNQNCDYVTAGVLTVWDSVGDSDFFSHYSAIFYFDDGNKTLDDYSADYGTSMYAPLWCAGRGLCPQYISGTRILDESAVIEACAAFNLAYRNAEQADADISGRVTRLNGSHSGTRMQALSDWWAESVLYAELALNPTGSGASYAESVSTFRSNLEQYRINAEMQ